uniref:PhoPQ-activated pathogenicity-related protein n=1 Tax=Candidatus Kentrum sp. LPFa TaxID=2126335 RepID=A0A450WWH4_9GAMM|nr:MAG: PhoPQ-activated pathogenicity-related protein [Candidatus Kentron sp. LPFa]
MTTELIGLPRRERLEIARFLLFRNTLLVLLALCGAGYGEQTAAIGALAEYVAKPDASYRWAQRREGHLGAAVYTELLLTSQTWRGIVWKHRLFVIRPSIVPPDVKHGLLFIAGGRWEDRIEEFPNDDQPLDQLPDEARRLADVAEKFRAPVALLLNVPRQPMFGDKQEDQLISLTFEKYLDTRDAEWPLLLPMVKSATRAMDAAGEYAEEAWGLPIETYTATGASKRGWTTWLLGAIDRRVTAIAPMVIDVLNMARQMEHQRDAWGDFSHEIGDYTERGLQDRLGTSAGEALLSMVDPYRYRRLLKQPKLIIIGTNDPYWPLDALNLYWNDLVGDKYILYVPNGRHDLADSSRVMGSLHALHQQAATGRPMPDLSWEFSSGNNGLLLRVSSDPPPHAMRAWVARAPTRDFREARWTAFPMGHDGGRNVYALTAPSAGFAAVFGEAEYRIDPLPCYLSTNVRIVGESPNSAKSKVGTEQ